MSSPQLLDALFDDLRAHDLRVGVAELSRVRQVCRYSDATANHSNLQVVLRSLLAKSRDEVEVFDAAFERWTQHAAESLRRRPVLSTDARTDPDPAWHPRERDRGDDRSTARRRIAVATALGLILIVAVAWALGMFESDTDEPDPPTVPPPDPGETETPPPPAEGIVERYPTHTVRFFDLPASPPTSALLLLGASALAAAYLARLAFLARARRPEIDDGPQAQRSLAVPHARLGRRLSPVLPRDDLRQMVWNIERFVSGDLSPKLDMPATVEATAQRGGLIHLVHEHFVYPREVWLWSDSLRDRRTSSLAARAQDEIATALQRSGLPVRTARFYATPAQCTDAASGESFYPARIESRAQQATVAVLTDGYGIAIAQRHAARQLHLDRLLRSLSNWPQLRFVDCANGRHGLARRLAPYRIRCIHEEELPADLGDEQRRRPAQTHKTALVGPLRTWAAALALTTDSFSLDLALDLREALGLRLPARSFDDLIHHAEPCGAARFRFDPTLRCDLLDWLCRIEDPSAPPCRGLAVAVDFWRAHYAALTVDDPQRATAIAFEDASLALYVDPDGAARALEVLHDGGLVTPLRDRLASFAARNQAYRADTVRLPWSWSDADTATGHWQPSAMTKVRLQRLGFAGDRLGLTASMSMPRAATLAFGVLLGVGLTLLAWPALRLLRTPAVVGEPPASGLIQGTTSNDGERIAYAGPPSELRTRVLNDNDLGVRWTTATRDNPERIGTSLIYRRGRRSAPARADLGVRRSLVLIDSPSDDPDGTELAVRLLDAGAADAVLIGTDSRADAAQFLIRLPAAATARDQLVFVTKDADSELPPFIGASARIVTNQIGSLLWTAVPGPAPLRTLWPGAEVVDSRGEPRLATQSSDPPWSIELVAIPAGSFTMGSAETEDGHFSDESKQHEVWLASFEMGKYEVTRGQYRAVAAASTAQLHLPESWYGGDDDQMPANNVSWEDAVAFCAALSELESSRVPSITEYRLPSEAEWEYACRAGTTTRFSFGSEDSDLGDHAWYVANSDSNAHRVGLKRPNSWSLYDMHGNVWEWCEDTWHSNYTGAPTDGSAWVDGNSGERLLRGGSAFSNPGVLRSACRYDGLPSSDRAERVGFRVVRGPRRQR